MGRPFWIEVVGRGLVALQIERNTTVDGSNILEMDEMLPWTHM